MAEKTKLTLYYDMLSQPSRSLFMLLKLTKTPFEAKPVSLMKGEHKAEHYVKEINPMKTVPMIQDGEFFLTESVAQLRYIASTQKTVADHWCPKDAQKQARVDEFLNWHHTGLRKPCLDYFLAMLQTKVPFKTPDGKTIPLSAEDEKTLKTKVETAVKTIEEYFLKDKKYITGSEISVADLIGYNELNELMAIGKEDVYSSNKRVGAWMKRIEDQLVGLKEETMAALKHVKSMYTGTK